MLERDTREYWCEDIPMTDAKIATMINNQNPFRNYITDMVKDGEICLYCLKYSDLKKQELERIEPDSDRFKMSDLHDYFISKYDKTMSFNAFTNEILKALPVLKEMKKKGAFYNYYQLDTVDKGLERLLKERIVYLGFDE